MNVDIIVIYVLCLRNMIDIRHLNKYLLTFFFLILNENPINYSFFFLNELWHEIFWMVFSSSCVKTSLKLNFRVKNRRKMFKRFHLQMTLVYNKQKRTGKKNMCVRACVCRAYPARVKEPEETTEDDDCGARNCHSAKWGRRWRTEMTKPEQMSRKSFKNCGRAEIGRCHVWPPFFF